MAVGIDEILQLHRKLREVLGPEEADTLMELLLPHTWRHIAPTHHRLSSDPLTQPGAPTRTD